MSQCCQSNSCYIKKTSKWKCPSCGHEALKVSDQTVMLHVKDAWTLEPGNETYYFCRTHDCDVAYFSQNDEIISKYSLRIEIGIKEQHDDALICYCFGVSKALAQSNKEIKEFVIKQTKDKNCACESVNPSGQCCLKDFPKFN